MPCGGAKLDMLGSNEQRRFGPSVSAYVSQAYLQFMLWLAEASAFQNHNM